MRSVTGAWPEEPLALDWLARNHARLDDPGDFIRVVTVRGISRPLGVAPVALPPTDRRRVLRLRRLGDARLT